jgi:hypothetical protein
MGALDAADFGDGLAPRASSTCKTMKLEDATQGKWGAYMSFGESKETGVISNRNAKNSCSSNSTRISRASVGKARLLGLATGKI